MSRDLRLDRRRVLQLGLGGVLAAVMRPIPEGPEPQAPVDKPLFHGLTPDPDEVDWLVRLLIESGRVAADRATLEVALLGPASGVTLRRMGGHELWDFVRAKTTSDFAEQRTLVVDGWVLLQTKAQVWILYALTSGGL